ncbi:MAG: DegT/DnrJ/EryC1/StrS family aminotransferase [Armatimonadota bacterium]|nr:DegT/DnrJ/EryC1/StrS family aminotransferase [Armatimonadota bacterium]
MPGESEEKKSDFRYATGDAQVPWAAIGEHVWHEDLMGLVRLLIKPHEDEEAFSGAMQRVEEALQELCACGRPVAKLSLGDTVNRLEDQVAEFLGCKYACFVTNATAGFQIGHQFADLGPGDEVILPAITFISTGIYPPLVGARCVFADIDPRTVNMDPDDVARKVTDRTKVIMPVHIGGYPVDMEPIMEIAEEHDIVVIEDAAHAFGGQYKGRMIGTIGHFGSFSFHEVKNINAFGEGGIVCTDTQFGEYFNQARFCGVDMSQQIENWLYDVVALPTKGDPQVAGNHSSTEIQAACLLGQMQRLEEIIRIRRERAEYLHERFEPVEGLVPAPLDTDEIKSTYHLYLLQVEPEVLGGDIRQLKQRLTEKGVTNIPHFAPLYHFTLFKQLGYDTEAIAQSCPNAEDVFWHRFTHLPLYPLTDQQVELMADLVIETVEEMKGGG